MPIATLLISPRNPAFKTLKNMLLMVTKVCQNAKVRLYPITSKQQKTSIIADKAILEDRIKLLRNFLGKVKKIKLAEAIPSLVEEYKTQLLDDNSKKLRKNSPPLKDRRLLSLAPSLPIDQIQTPILAATKVENIHQEIFVELLPQAIAQYEEKATIYQFCPIEPPNLSDTESKSGETTPIPGATLIKDIKKFAETIATCSSNGTAAHFLFPLHQTALLLAQIPSSSSSNLTRTSLNDNLTKTIDSNDKLNAAIKERVEDAIKAQFKRIFKNLKDEIEGKTLVQIIDLLSINYLPNFLAVVLLTEVKKNHSRYNHGNFRINARSQPDVF